MRASNAAITVGLALAGLSAGAGLNVANIRDRDSLVYSLPVEPTLISDGFDTSVTKLTFHQDTTVHTFTIPGVGTEPPTYITMTGNGGTVTLPVETSFGGIYPPPGTAVPTPTLISHTFNLTLTATGSEITTSIASTTPTTITVSTPSPSGSGTASGQTTNAAASTTTSSPNPAARPTPFSNNAALGVVALAGLAFAF